MELTTILTVLIIQKPLRSFIAEIDIFLTFMLINFLKVS